VEFKAVVTNELSEQNTYETKRLVYLLEELDEVQAVRHNGILKEGVELMFSNLRQRYADHFSRIDACTARWC